MRETSRFYSRNSQILLLAMLISSEMKKVWFLLPLKKLWDTNGHQYKEKPQVTRSILEHPKSCKQSNCKDRQEKTKQNKSEYLKGSCWANIGWLPEEMPEK